MPLYRIHRIKAGPRESFRWAAHTGGLAVVKAKDYEASGEQVEAATPYAAWKILAGEKRALCAGDILENFTQETGGGELQIFKYIGFEAAKWYVPEAISDTGTTAAELAGSAIPAT